MLFRYPEIVIFATWAIASSTLAAEPTQIRLVDVTDRTGISFVHSDGSSGAHYLVEAVASGMATLDFDLDGDLDLYFLNGAALKGASYQTPPRNALYRNDGNWQFTDVTEQSGLGDEGFGLGVAVGDYDNDGWPDVYVNNYGANALYRNNGDGSFQALAGQPEIACGEKVGGGVTMLDIEADGDLDIYVANYIQFEYDLRPPSIFHGRVVYGGPVLFPTEPDDLLRNNGDGTFTNVSDQSGISAHSEWGMATIGLDADLDGDTDIFVANDSTRNFLWENDGQGKFTEIGLISGTAYDYQGNPQGSMGVDAADFNGDLLLDLFQTAFENQMATLYENSEGGFFEDVTLRTGAGAGTYHYVNWGTAFADLDNDGDQDLFMANGHIHDNLDEFDDTTSYKIRNQVYENLGNGHFVDVSQTCGEGMVVRESSRGSIVDDLDSDGCLDVVILNSRTKPTVLRNECNASANWIEIELVGTSSNRSAVGSQVLLTAGGKSQLLEVHSGRGYQSHFGSQLHFGLGENTTVDRVVVRWLGGGVEEFSNIRANQRLLVRQGLGISSRSRNDE